MAPQTGVHGDRAQGAQGRAGGRERVPGIEGFGASSLVHTQRLLSLSEDLPVAVVVVDAEEKIRAFCRSSMSWWKRGW